MFRAERPARLRALAFAASVLCALQIAAAPALAHGWRYVFISHDYVEDGVQGHGGIVTRYKHVKYVTEVAVMACRDDEEKGECDFVMDEKGNVYYTGGGHIWELAFNRRSCFNPRYSDIQGGYSCEAMTPVRSSDEGKFCWSTMRGKVYNASGKVVHRGARTSPLGNCRS